MSTEDATAAAAAAAAAASQEAANAAAAASAAATANWPIGGYTFISFLIRCMFVVLAIYVDVSTICLVHDFIIEFQYAISSAHAMFMIYSWINLIKQLLKLSTQTSSKQYQ